MTIYQLSDKKQQYTNNKLLQSKGNMINSEIKLNKKTELLKEKFLNIKTKSQC